MDVITAEGRSAPKTTAPKPAAEIDIGIEGMTCASCVRRVEKALSGVPGVVDASVNLGTERARIALADNADAAALTEAVDRRRRTAMSASCVASGSPGRLGRASMRMPGCRPCSAA